MDMKSGIKASSDAEPDDEVVEGVKFTPVNEVSIFFEMINLASHSIPTVRC